MTRIRDLEPIGHVILVRLKKIPKERETITESGIVIPKVKERFDSNTNTSKTVMMSEEDFEKEQDAHVEAYVIEIGTKSFKYLDNHEGKGEWLVKPGDCVLIGRYAGINRTKDDSDTEVVYRLIRDNDIQGRFRGEGLSRDELLAMLEVDREAISKLDRGI